MGPLDKLERKFGKHPINHLTMFMIATYVTGYILELIGSASGVSIISLLGFHPGLIARGQVWRIISWLLIPPDYSFNIWSILMIFCIYQQGTMLERIWGDFKYDFYIFNGLILTLIAGFIAYAIRPGDFMVGMYLFSTYYVSLSVFLGLALTFPDMEFRFMFLIPIRAKYLVILYAITLIYSLISYRSVVVGAMIIASVVNMVLFFWLYKKGPRLNRSQRRTRDNYRRTMYGQGRGQKVDRTTFGNQNSGYNQAGRGSAKQMQGYGAGKNTNGKRPFHRCAVCGRTELDDPNLEFRYCSKCNGAYEYCQDHLYNHEHVK
jgi:hypothetical protein